jgi:hypothetical protein
MLTENERDVGTQQDAGAPVAVYTGRAWPDLIVDRGCLDLFSGTLGGLVGGHSPLPMDVSSLLASGSGGSSILVNATAVIVGARTCDGTPSYEAIQQLRSLAPQVGIVVLVPTLDAVKRWMPRLAAAGMDEVLAADAPPPVSARSRTIRHRLAAPAPETELRLLWRWFRDCPERALIMHCLRNAYWHDDWALRSLVFGASRKTLQNRLTALDQPSPGLIVRCGRMLHVQELERRGIRPSGLVANVVGIPSRSALYRARRRLRQVLMMRGSSAVVFASLLR